MDEQERQTLIEEVASAWRTRGDEGIQTHPAWEKLDEAGRSEAFEIAAALRKIEAALDEEGLSTTGRVVLEQVMQQVESDRTEDNVVKLSDARKGNGAPVRKPDTGMARVISFPKRVMQSQPWAMAAVALLVVGVGLLSVRERQGPGTGTLDGEQVAANEEVPKKAETAERERPQAVPAEEERVEVAEADPQAKPTKERRRRRKRDKPAAEEPAPEDIGQDEAPALAAAEPPPKADTTTPGEEPSELPDLAPGMQGRPGSANALSEGDQAQSASEHEQKICRMRVSALEEMVGRKANYEPPPEEQLAAGRCYNILGNKDKSKHWLERAAKHPDTKAAAERELRKLNAK